jgi:predicted nucleic acid-binding protein
MTRFLSKKRFEVSGNKIVLDTNIILYLLSGNQELYSILNGMELYVSIITEVELLGFHGLSDTDKIRISNFLDDCIIINLNTDIKNVCIDVKQKSKSKTPDALVAATSIHLQIPLVTADKGFEKIENLDLFLYKI